MDTDPPDVAGSPCAVAYLAAHTPATGHTFTDIGVWCTQCGRSGPTTPFRGVVSAKFTNFDAWTYDTGRLCRACTWSYTADTLRRTAYLVDTSPTAAMTVLDRRRLGRTLETALPTTRSVIVPVRGRKHILPFAHWGHVCTDDTAVRWDDAAVRLLNDLRALRTLPMATATAVASPVPPMAVLRACERSEWPGIIDQWQRLDPWRTRRGWWDAAIALSTPATTTSGRR